MKGWKRPQEVSSANFCSKQHQFWDQTKLFRAIYGLVWKPPWMEPTQCLAHLLHCLTVLMPCKSRATVGNSARQKVQFHKLPPNSTEERPALHTLQSGFYLHETRRKVCSDCEYNNKLWLLVEVVSTLKQTIFVPANSYFEHFFLTRRARKSCFQLT